MQTNCIWKSIVTEGEAALKVSKLWSNCSESWSAGLTVVLFFIFCIISAFYFVCFFITVVGWASQAVNVTNWRITSMTVNPALSGSHLYVRRGWIYWSSDKELRINSKQGPKKWCVDEKAMYSLLLLGYKSDVVAGNGKEWKFVCVACTLKKDGINQIQS